MNSAYFLPEKLSMASLYDLENYADYYLMLHLLGGYDNFGHNFYYARSGNGKHKVIGWDYDLIMSNVHPPQMWEMCTFQICTTCSSDA